MSGRAKPDSKISPRETYFIDRWAPFPFNTVLNNADHSHDASTWTRVWAISSPSGPSLWMRHRGSTQQNFTLNYQFLCYATSYFNERGVGNHWLGIYGCPPPVHTFPHNSGWSPNHLNGGWAEPKSEGELTTNASQVMSPPKTNILTRMVRPAETPFHLRVKRYQTSPSGSTYLITLEIGPNDLARVKPGAPRAPGFKEFS